MSAMLLSALQILCWPFTPVPLRPAKCCCSCKIASLAPLRAKPFRLVPTRSLAIPVAIWTPSVPGTQPWRFAHGHADQSGSDQKSAFVRQTSGQRIRGRACRSGLAETEPSAPRGQSEKAPQVAAAD
jgi:hypothetical protein